MSLSHRAIKGIAWTTADRWASRVVSMIVFAILARLLKAEDFGLVALATAFVGFSDIVASQGLGFAVIMRKDVGREQLDAAFWANVAMGLVVTTALLAAAAFVGLHRGNHPLGLVMAGMSIAFFLTCFGRIHAAWMTRELQFGPLAARNLSATIAGGITGVIFAYRGAGAMAIVAQSIVGAAVGLVAVWIGCSWRPSLRFSWKAFMDVYGYGWKIFLDRMVVWARDNADVLLIGSVVGMQGLGIYAVAKKVIDLLGSLFVSIVTTVVYPVFSKAQDDLTRLVAGFDRAIRMTAVVLLPLFLGTAVLAPEALRVAAGSGWDHAIPLVQIMAIAAAVSWIDPFVGAVLLARQKPGVVLVVHLIGAVTSAIAVVIGGWWGLMGVCIAVAGRRIAGSVLLLRFGEKTIAGMSMTRSMSQFVVPFIGSSAMVAATTLVRDAMPTTLTKIGVGIAAGVVTYTVAYLVLAKVTRSDPLGELFQLITRRRRPGVAGVIDPVTLPQAVASS